VSDFVPGEARLLDLQRFDEWLGVRRGQPLLDAARADQTDPRLVASLMYEDKLLSRSGRSGSRATAPYSQKPRSSCHHVLQVPRIERRDEAGSLYVT